MKRLIILLIFSSLITVIKAQPISQLPAATTLNPADLIPIVQSGVTKKIQAAKIVQFLADSLSNVRILSDTCLEVTYRGALDTMCFSQQDMNWSVTGNDIENSNTGDVTLKGQVYVPDIAASGAKYPGTIAGIGIDDGLFPLSIVNLHEDTKDTLISLKAYGRENELTVGAVEEMYSDFSTAVAAAGTGDVIDLSNATFTEAGTVALPANAILRFQPGANLAGTFTLAGKNIRIDAGRWQIFGANVTITDTSTFIYDAAYPEWFGADPNGVIDASAEFGKMAQILGVRSKVRISGEYLINDFVNLPLFDGITYDFTGGKIVSDDATGRLRLNTNSGDLFLSGLDSSAFNEDAAYEIEKDSLYVKIADSAAWQALGSWNGGQVQINIASSVYSEGAYAYYKAISFAFDRFGVVGGEQVIYAKYPFPADLELYDDSLHFASGEYYIQVIPLYNNVLIKGLEAKNLQTQIYGIINSTIKDCHLYSEDRFSESQDLALGLQYGENILVDNIKVEKYEKGGMGYGLSVSQTNNLSVINSTFLNCRHGTTITGAYLGSSNNIRLSNINISNANIDNHGNCFNVSISNITHYGQGSVISCRHGSAININNVKSLNGDDVIILIESEDAWGDGDVTISNVVSTNGKLSVLKTKGLDNVNINISDCQIIGGYDLTGNPKFICYDENSTFGNVTITDCKVIGDDAWALSSGIINGDSTIINSLLISGCHGQDVGFLAKFSDGSALSDKAYFKNNYLNDYNYVIQIDRLADTANLYITNSTFTSGNSILNMADATAPNPTYLYVTDNKINTLANAVSGNIVGFNKFYFKGNEVKNYTGATSFIRTLCVNAELTDNTFNPYDSKEVAAYIAARSGGMQTVSNADSLLITGSRTTADYVTRIEGNRFMGKLCTGTDLSFALNSLYFKNNIINPVDAAMRGDFLGSSNMDAFEVYGNTIIYNAASKYMFKAGTDATQIGTYYLIDNTIINLGNTANGYLWYELSGFTNGSTVIHAGNKAYGIVNAMFLHQSGTTVTRINSEAYFGNEINITSLTGYGIDINRVSTSGIYNRIRNTTLEWNYGTNSSEHFIFKDVTNNLTPVTFQSAAPNNSLFIETTTGDIGIGTGSPAYDLDVVGSARLSTFLLLTPTADPPGSAVEGMIYADTDHHLYYYNGVGWIQLDN